MIANNVFRDEVMLSHVVISKPGGAPLPAPGYPRPMNILQRKLSVMGTHIHLPVPDSTQMERKHEDNTPVTPEFSIVDVDEAPGPESPFLRV